MTYIPKVILLQLPYSLDISSVERKSFLLEENLKEAW